MEHLQIIGITGTIGSGKTTVGNFLAELGFPVIDADHIVHSLQDNDREIQAAIRKRFGDRVFDSNGKLSRPLLGSIVFADMRAKKDLESIIHPAILRECKKQIASLADKHKYIFVLVPLLFEASRENDYHEIWCVIANEHKIKQRLKEYKGLSDKQIDKCLASQLSQEEKKQRSHRVINNSGTIKETQQQVNEILEQNQIKPCLCL